VAGLRDILIGVAMAACGSLLCWPARGAEPASPTAAKAPQAPGQDAAQPPSNGTHGKLVVTVGKSLVIDSPLDIRRLSVANGDLAEAVAVNPKEVLINGKMPGETSLIVWQQSGARLIYDLTVRMSNNKLDAVRQQIARDFPKEEINVTFENDTAFVRGTVQDVTAAERVMSMATTLGKTVNLLRVQVPPVEQQVVLKVKFANVDRSAGMQLGVDWASTAFNQTSVIGNGPPIMKEQDGKVGYLIGQAVNIFLQRPDINLAAAITALQSKHVLEVLAEPNLLAISGQPASFLAGGEFPFPIVQPSAGASAISIMWREYGIRLNFQPNVTPRGTIRLKVAPEVSSLDYANAVTVQGQTIPGIATRRVQTEVELDNLQSFVIAGLLDQQATENLSKIPGISAIPVLGKLFQSKTMNRHNSELLVIITPEIVRPIPAGQAPPDLKWPTKFLEPNTDPALLSHPGADKTGALPAFQIPQSLPFEQLAQKQGQAAAPTILQLMPAPAPPAAPANPNPGIGAPPVGQAGSAK
jgi:pilus assembly protein CpaC